MEIIINKKETILFYPHKPDKHTVIYKILKTLDLSYTDCVNENFIIAINWEDITIRKRYDFLEEINTRKPVLNLKCKDISKKNVDEIFKKVFGYSLLINPSNYKGFCLVKNDLNAKHDGKIEECPIKEINQNYVYQRIINNTNENGEYYDIRVPIFQNHIPFVYLKTKAERTRFRDRFLSATISTTNDVFSQAEVEKINKFCSLIGMDYGELDILRDKISKKIYIIDANNTPWGPPSELSANDSEFVLIELAKAFRTAFINLNTK